MRNDEVRVRVALGFAGGLVASLAMNLFARAAVPAGLGDRAGHGMQPPQADGSDDDAAVRVGAAAYRVVTNTEPDDRKRQWLGTAAHYGFGGAMGACYALMAPASRAVRTARGTLYGAAVWVAADETLLPLLGLSRGGRQLPAAVHAYAFAGHLVYGLALDSTMRALERLGDRRAP